MFTELFFIMSSIWQHQFYYLFGFLGLVLIILVVTCAEIAIAPTYFQLTSEDYRWWWRAFLSSQQASQSSPAVKTARLRFGTWPPRR